MAIDTANKRGSSFLDDCGIDFPPDGLIDTPDRAWLLGQYYAVAVPAAAEVIFQLESRPTIFRLDPHGTVFQLESRPKIFRLDPRGTVFQLEQRPTTYQV